MQLEVIVKEDQGGKVVVELTDQENILIDLVIHAQVMIILEDQVITLFVQEVTIQDLGVIIQ